MIIYGLERIENVVKWVEGVKKPEITRRGEGNKLELIGEGGGKACPASP